MANHPAIALGGGVLLFVALMALAAPLVAPIPPQDIAPFDRLKTPGADYWFGTDMLGRDVFSRTVYGARVSMIVGLCVAGAAVAVGLAVGLLSGFVRAVDAVAMRVMDAMMAIPSILLAVALIALSGPSLRNIIFSIAVSEVPRVARLTRSLVLSLREQPFIDAAIAAGTPFRLILLRHILPNTVAPLLVQGSHIFAAAVMTEAALSFVGAGVPPQTPSWGNLIADGRMVFQLAPHVVLFPSLVLAMTVLAVNFVGDGLRDATDPRFVRRA